MFFKILTVALLSTFEIYAAIPAGFAFKLAPWVILLASVSGGLAGVFVAAFLGDKIRAFIARYKKPKVVKPEEVKESMVHRIWNKYGIIGLGFLGTITVGAPVSIAVGLGFNASLKKLLTWCCIGVVTRCTVFTLIGHYGVQLL
jgi:membrane protein YqaA with SNARE-associated domain